MSSLTAAGKLKKSRWEALAASLRAAQFAVQKSASPGHGRDIIVKFRQP
jgi:hypothetical protein